MKEKGERLMSFEEFLQMISDITKIPIHSLHRDASFRDELDVDSMQMVNLLIELTTRFGIEGFKFKDNKDLETVWGMYQMVLREEIKY